MAQSLDDNSPHRPTLRDIANMVFQIDVLVYLCSVVALVALYVFNFNTAHHVLIASTILFTAFDAVVYKRVLQQANHAPRLAYRIVQTSLQITLYVLLFREAWYAPLLFMWLHKMGVCDCLYYALTREWKWAWNYTGEWYWLGWTLPAKVGITMNFKRLCLSSAIAVLVSEAILWLM